MFRYIRRMFARRTSKLPVNNFFEALTSVAMHYDFDSLTEEQLIILLGNSVRQTDGILKEIQFRGMDTGAILDIVEKKVQEGSLSNDPEADKIIKTPGR